MWLDGLVIHSWGFPNCSFIFFYSHLLKPEGFGKWLTGNHNKADPLSTLPSQFSPQPFISTAVSVMQMRTLCPVNCNITAPITQTNKQWNTGVNKVKAADLPPKNCLSSCSFPMYELTLADLCGCSISELRKSQVWHRPKSLFQRKYI